MLHRLKDSIGFDVYDTFPYTPKAFREKKADGEYIIPKVLWPIFTLKSKDGLEISNIEDSSGFLEYKKDGSSVWHSRSGNLRVTTLSTGILKIKNLPLENGAKFLSYDKSANSITISENGQDKKSDAASYEEVIKYLKVNLQIELQNAINERSSLTEEERRGLEF